LTCHFQLRGIFRFQSIKRLRGGELAIRWCVAAVASAPIPAVRAAALFVPDHLPATYVCAYYSLLNFVWAQAKC
jgi:hypothetical protein